MRRYSMEAMKHGLLIAIIVAGVEPMGAAAQGPASAPAATTPAATTMAAIPGMPGVLIPRTILPSETVLSMMPGVAPATTTAATDPGLFNPPPKKEPIPTDRKLALASRDVHETYATSYAKTTPAERADLARRFLEAGSGTKLEPHYRYFLLREAADMAMSLGDFYTTMNALDDLGAAFIVDEKKLRTQYLEGILRHAAAQPHLTSRVARQYLLLADSALEADAYADAGRMAARASALAVDAREPALGRRAAQRLAAARMGEADAEKAAAARIALARNPQDQLANLALGRFDCFVRGDFAQGVPLLARAFDPELKAAAARELKAGSDADELAAAADAWWDLAAALPRNDVGQGAIRGHAHELYVRAVPKLAGLAKAKAEKRAADIEADGGADETFTLTRAVWGNATTRSADVTAVAAKLIHPDGTGIIQANPAFFGDPMAGMAKALTLTFTYHGKQQTVTIPETGVEVFPPIPHDGILVPTQDFRIVEAFWGRGNAWTDVTTKTRQLVKGPTVQFKPSPQIFGVDPAPLQPKFFLVVYEYSGRRYGRSVVQLEGLTLNGK
jgi:hypothetical protein